MFKFPTQSVTLTAWEYRTFLGTFPEMWYRVKPLPDNVFRIAFKAGEIPEIVRAMNKDATDEE